MYNSLGGSGDNIVKVNEKDCPNKKEKQFNLPFILVIKQVITKNEPIVYLQS
jgi:hypothetical protein